MGNDGSSDEDNYARARQAQEQQAAAHRAGMARQAEALAVERARVQAELDRVRRELEERKAAEEREARRIADEKAAEKRTMAEAPARLGLNPKRFNVAIAGDSGVGKSTMINALLGPGLPDADYAEVGVIETTQAPRAFNIPGSLLTVWDLPGFGTALHPIATYVSDKMLYVFDCVVIMYKGRVPQGLQVRPTAVRVCVSSVILRNYV